MGYPEKYPENPNTGRTPRYCRRMKEIGNHYTGLNADVSARPEATLKRLLVEIRHAAWLLFGRTRRSPRIRDRPHCIIWPSRCTAPRLAMSDNNSDLPINEDRLWKDDGWTARVVKNEDDEGWAVAMFKDGESEPALVTPMPSSRLSRPHPKCCGGMNNNCTRHSTRV
jgi:hypothetical protein